ncbi:MAG: hypothetical protein AB1428_08310 [Bacteroidota bacterium]
MVIAFRYTSILLIAMDGAASADAQRQADSDIWLDNGLVRVVLVREEGEYVERWYARRGGDWVFVFEGGNEIRAAQTIGSAAGKQAIRFTEASALGAPMHRRLELRGTVAGDTLIKTIGLEEGSRFARVAVTMKFQTSRDVSSLLSTYSFIPQTRSGTPEFVFTPALRPEADEVIADHSFRSPAFILQTGTVAGAIVPDLSSIDGKGRPIRAGADLQVKGLRRPLISFGLMHWKRKKAHVYYELADTATLHIAPGGMGYGYFVYLTAGAPEKKAYREIVRFLWEKYGEPDFQKAVNPQAEPFASYIHKAWHEFMPSVALDTVYEGKPVTLLRQARLAWSNNLPKAADNDCWFNVWFNALRTAYGMHLYGREHGDAALAQRAERVLNLALLAPKGTGLRPTIFYVDSSGGHWVADHGWGGIENGRLLPMFHNAWTAYWVLRWRDRVPQRGKELLDYAKEIGGFLIAHQLSTGVIPSWYDPATGEPSPVLRDENGETAGAALLLSELANATGDSRYRDAAERAMRYILTEIEPHQRWYDFETFFSCSQKPVDFFDSVTHQPPQNTLSMQMAAEACASLYELTKDERYREAGSAILDYLCLYQQVWSPQWLSCQLFGGFGVQNTDGEWSDSRQGYFAMTLMKYYELTGRREYLERSVAALRSMFSLFESPQSPRTAENYAHGAYDQLAGVTGLHWGTGSSVVSIHLIAGKYGDAFVDLNGSWGAGIDGCRITNVTVSGEKISVTLFDNVNVSRKVKVKFGGAGNITYAVVVNGKSLGRFDGTALTRGIDVDL